jgi:hypothetical protein
VTAPEASVRRIVGVLALAWLAGAAAPALAVEAAALDAVPLVFEQNQGQLDASVQFLARGAGYKVHLTAREAVAVFDHAAADGERIDAVSVLRMRFEGANERARAVGQAPFAHRTNYFRGADRTERVTGIRNFSRVTYAAVYPGVDVVYYGNQGMLEYDLVVAPGADPRQVRVRFTGQDRADVAPDGTLALRVRHEEIRYQRPVAYQEHDGERVPVEASYELAGDGTVAFNVGAYDTARPLIIDPILSYSTFFWGARAIAVGPQDNAYITGLTSDPALPTSSGYQTALKGAADAFVVKLDPSGRTVLYATYLGARRATTIGRGVAVDASGSAYVIGTTDGSAFPTTTGAYQRTFATGASFVTKLNASGNALLYSTFVNGAELSDIVLDASNNAYVTGRASISTPFSTTPGALQPTSGGGVIGKLNAAGSAMVYATYFASPGDSCSAIALDAAGNAYVTGTTASTITTQDPLQPSPGGFKDAFVAKLDATGTALVFATYLGGSDDEYANDIAVDSFGDAYVVGRTDSRNFPVTFGAFRSGMFGLTSGFISKLSSNGASLVYSSYFGGNWCPIGSCTLFGDDGTDVTTGVAVDPAGFAYIAGWTRAKASFPHHRGIQSFPAGGDEDSAPYLARLLPAGNSVAYSVVIGPRKLGVRSYGIAIDSTGAAYGVGGGYEPTDAFPITAGMPLAFNNGGFVFKISNGAHPTVVQTSKFAIVAGESVTFTAEVSGVSPPGTVTFMDKGTPIGTAPVSNGTAVLTVTTLAAGSHSITAVHSGDGIVSRPFYQIVTSQ